MNMRKQTWKAAVSAAAICVAAALPSWAGAARYAQPVWSMGNFNPEDPQGSLIAVTASPRLAFKGLTLAQVKAKLDEGYELSAQMFGGHLNGKGTIVSLYNIRYYPSADSIENIFGNFCIVDGGLPKAVCVEFTDGEDGVYVKALKALYALNGAVTTDFMNVAADGTVTYKNYKQFMNLATSWSATSYGAGNLQLAKFIPSGSPLLVFPGATLDEIKDYGFTGYMGGAEIPHGFECAAYNKRVMLDDGGSATNIVVEMQRIHDGNNKCVVVQLTNGEGGVYAKGVAALYAANEELGYEFANGDGTYNGTGVSVATGYGQADYGVYGLTAQKKGVYSTSSSIIGKTTAALVWPDITLDDIKDCWLACRFTGTSIVNKGCDSVGCNRNITYDDNGSATNIRVEYQMHDTRSSGNNWIKCVVVDLTNGVGGVCAKKICAGYVSGASNSVGYRFNITSGNSSYDVYDLCALPCIALDGDADWSPYGRQLLGDAVVDLNGHKLTAGELAFDTSRTGMVLNTANSTVADMNFFTFDGGIISNVAVNIGYNLIDGENIRLVTSGYGTYYAAKAQEYKGGTVVDGGTLKPVRNSVAGTLVLGATSGAVQVNQNGILDWNATYNYQAYPAFVLNGGTMQNAGSVDFDGQYALVKGMTLLDDSQFLVSRSWGLINGSYASLSLNLNGNALSISISNGKMMRFSNINATAGTINALGAGILEVMNKGVGFSGPEVNLHGECELRLSGAMTVHDYEAAHTKNGANLGGAALNVKGTFKPTTTYFHGVTMQDGSTMDFSAWPEAAGWPVANAYTCTGEKEIKFAEAGEDETTTVTVKLGDRKVTGGKIFSWADGADVSRVKFVRGDADRRYALAKKDDGLYVVNGMIVIVK